MKDRRPGSNMVNQLHSWTLLSCVCRLFSSEDYQLLKLLVFCCAFEQSVYMTLLWKGMGIIFIPQLLFYSSFIFSFDILKQDT